MIKPRQVQTSVVKKSAPAITPQCARGRVCHDVDHTPYCSTFKGLVALIVLFLVTLIMEPRAEVTVLRAMIAVGAAIVVGKIILRHYNIDWPPRRH